MKIFISIKKKWLQYRVYKYTLKYSNALSKSNYYLELSKNHNNQSASILREFGIYGRKEALKEKNLSTKYMLESEKFSNRSNIYLDKKLDLEEQLSFLNYPKA